MVCANTRFVVFLLLIVVHTIYGQKQTVSGTVLDANKSPVPYANIVLKTYENAQFVQGTTSDESGLFKFEKIKSGHYSLLISFLGYETITAEFKLENDLQLQPYTLIEKNYTLQDVNIVAKRPTVKRTIDRLIFNVEQSTLSNENILNVLKHTPSVFVDNGTIKVKTTTPTIYINNRKVHLSTEEVQQLLEGTTATNVKAIEVLSNPPAQYEAEGGAVINIITSKNVISGYNGSVYGNYNQGFKYPKLSLGTSHFYKTKKFNTYLNYNINPSEDYRGILEKNNFYDKQKDITRWDTDYKRNRKTLSHNINGNFEYEINNSNVISLTTNMLFSPRKANVTKINSLTDVLDKNYNLDSLFNTYINATKSTANVALTLDYVHNFKKEGEKLLLNIHHTNYRDYTFQDVNTGYFLPNAESPFRNNRFGNDNNQTINLYTSQVDYELPISESQTFMAGVKASNIYSDNGLSQYMFKSGNSVQDFSNSDVFKYNETNLATYASYAKEWSKWSVKAGLRLEHTDTKSKSEYTKQDYYNDYIKFFPSLYVLNAINDNNEWFFNYNRRIHRPRYTGLSPFRYYLNDNTFSVGNPNLKPQIDDVLTLGYTLKSTYTFEAYYRYENSPTLEVLFQDNEENTLQYINTNIDKSISYGLDFTTYTPINNDWSIYVLASAFFYENNFYDLENGTTYNSNKKWSVYSQFVNYFSFLKDKSLTADVSLVYISPIYNGPTLVTDRFNLDISFRKTFWKNRASLSLGVTDLFNTQSNYNQTTKYLNQDTRVKSTFETRMFTFGFNYKFGNYRLKTTTKAIEVDERNRL